MQNLDAMLGRYKSLIPRISASEFEIFDVLGGTQRDILHVTPGWQAPDPDFTEILGLICPSPTTLNVSTTSNSATGREYIGGWGS